MACSVSLRVKINDKYSQCPTYTESSSAEEAAAPQAPKSPGRPPPPRGLFHRSAWAGIKARGPVTHGWHWLIMVMSELESRPELAVQIHSFLVQAETIIGFPSSARVTQIQAKRCVFEMLARISKTRHKISCKTESDNDRDRFGAWREGVLIKGWFFTENISV